VSEKEWPFSLDREQSLRRIEQTDAWDMVVIGGGATGLGTALDAVSRGFNVLLLEQSDFCKATSSRSTKLIHGGVRYLEQAEVGLVRSALKERGQLLDNAPHVVTKAEFVIPTNSLFERLYYGVGLKVYDLMSWGHRLGTSQLLSGDTLREKLPNLKADSFSGGVSYRDAQFDDARLGIQLAQTIEQHGGTVLNYARVSELLTDDGTVTGVVVEDTMNDQTYQNTADTVINATGIFTDEIRQMADPESRDLMTFSRGSHIVVDGDFLPGSNAMLIPKTEDGRVLFAIPWKNRTLIGTTDIPVPEPTLDPSPTDEEINYMLEHVTTYLKNVPERNDILSTYAGLRPLVASNADKTSEISRDHHVEVTKPGMITVTGGKWTTFREMGEDAVDQAINSGTLSDKSSSSRDVEIHGYTTNQASSDHLSVWGSDRERINDFIEGNPEWGKPLHPDLPYPRGIVPWSVRHEMARTVEDVLSRRTRCLILDARATMNCAEDVAELMVAELGYDEDWQKQQVKRFRELAENYIP
jgi:glycerol-3-phosphate dehydrogenase